MPIIDTQGEILVIKVKFMHKKISGYWRGVISTLIRSGIFNSPPTLIIYLKILINFPPVWAERDGFGRSGQVELPSHVISITETHKNKKATHGPFTS